MMPADPMRRFAWVLVVAGLLIIGLPGSWYAYRYVELATYKPHPWTGGLGQQMAADALAALPFPWTAVTWGAGLAGFGVLLLAIRRPVSHRHDC